MTMTQSGARASGSATMASINITPLIDVMLVLLIIFMVISPPARSLDASLPQPSRQARQPTPVPDLLLTLEEIPGTGSVIRLNTTPVSSLEDLAARLNDAFQARSERTLFVKAGGEVPYGRVVEAMDVARGAGAERIGILSTVVR
jgi:biopolymer transport protein TolR